MKEEDRTKDQLISELAGLRQRVAELETLVSERKRMEQVLKERTKELHKAEERFSGIYNSSKDAIGYVNLEGVLLDVNDSFCELTGYSKEELLTRRKYQEITPEEYHEYEAKVIERIMRTGKHAEYEKEYIRKDGSRVPILLTTFIVKGDDGKPIGLAAIIKDITERKRAEGALRESEKKYREIFNKVPASIIVLDKDGRMVDINPHHITTVGKSKTTRKDYLGKNLITHPSIVNAGLSETYARLLKGESFDLKDVYFPTTTGGSDGYSDVKGVPLLREGEVIGAITMFEDITERKQAEEALRESEERYGALLNLGGSVGEAIVMVQDKDGGDAIQTFVSNEWPRITGYSKKELLGMSFFDLLHPRYRDASLRRHQRKMDGEIIPGLFEMSFIRKDGTEVPIELTSAYTTYKGERANVAFIRDITERKQAEEREKELQKELNLSSRLASVGELAAGVAHEINNPLTGIIGFSQRLLRKSTDEEVSRDLEMIHNEALQAARVVENLQTFARRREPKKQYSDTNDIVQKALELRTYELKTSNIEVISNLAPSLPETMVDFHQIQEVFLNIILNAEQVMTEAHGEGKLTIKTKEVKDYIRISFTDDGSGIPAEHLDKVFDPFFTTREEGGGTGLGLSICHGIVTEHGGRIYVRSKPGKGATFIVELPCP